MMSSVLKVSIAAAVVLMVSGCASPNGWRAIGGSKSDAVVRLSYELLGKQVADESDGLKLAEQRCGYWGFSGAKAFELETKTCIDEQCHSYIITREYQCVD
ncbi:YecR family lipoprotein [uncultured Shewanella sp.]|uniref:YecR family lipoprotein n=1 Tax=Shewanella atlantica TaxID=271099 RepID=UPI002601D298|nr:YecR family lipoprotein [uncultured Shewanella sp.]